MNLKTKKDKKMKKEYIILIGIILILCTYLFVHKDNRDNYSLPQIPKIETKEITGIDIIKNQKQISFSRDQKVWTLTDKTAEEMNYPADPFMIDKMLNALKSLKLTTLVAQDGYLNRYELDEKQGLRIQFSKGHDVVFEIMLGKTAPTFNHTFVKLSLNDNVYHAAGNLKPDFDKDILDFRDKKVLSFNKAAIKQFTIAKDNVSKTLTLTQKKNEKEQAVITWNFQDNTPADLNTAAALLSGLSDLRCETYPDTAIEKIKEQATAVYRVSLKGTVDHELTLYKTEADKNLIGVSSMNKYVFTLNKHNENEIITSIEKLLGIYNPKDKEE